ncbi:M1 family aminopeptidase [Chryseobacterium tructae]|uniref:M1 family aminopeptidase n=1 Tax=Chryseobacterium tructae TaxID=1037380 RepID=A0ABV7Y1X2_9FLAO|nr:M1 family aminopeptidase [Chryseobacterium tructae]MDN3694210.1 M1 family aminopeptidase [Chryseobacterium tructae]
MNALLSFEIQRNTKHWLTYLIAIILIFSGIFCGNQFNLSVGEGIYLNSPYTIGFMIGMLSLSIIFLATIFALQILFKERDSKFDIMLFSYPLSKETYLKGKFLIYFSQTFLSFSFLILGFIVGQNVRSGSEMQPDFNLEYYLYPLLIFGLVNSLLVCSFLFLLSMVIRKKLLVVVGGLMLYVFYMIILLFSNSPFMAGSLPQSLEAQQFSAIVDPFGLSSFFQQSRLLTATQKNTHITSFTGYLLLNRVFYLILSAGFWILCLKQFSFSNISGQKLKKAPLKTDDQPRAFKSEYAAVLPDYGRSSLVQSILSFAKIDSIYLFKSITVPAVSILLIFSVGMEMYAEIEKGIRIPQKYASSGLMATTISENFHLLGLFIVAYFLNDLYWRSRSSGFFLIENSTSFSKNKLAGHFLSISILLFFFTGILILEGIIFQAAYHYFHIDWNAYLAVFLFNTFPLLLFSGFILLINDRLPHKFVALGLSVFAVLILASPVSSKTLSYPLLRIFSDFKGSYSDFNGYGSYTKAIGERLLFGTGIIAFLWTINEWVKHKKFSLTISIFSIILLIFGTTAGSHFITGYVSKDHETEILNSVQYEKYFLKYENIPQPDITDVKTEIQLNPIENSYVIIGTYILKNQTEKSIHKILINFHPDLKLESAIFKTETEIIRLNHNTPEVSLKNALQPNDTAVLHFKISYQWYPVNGHQSFNAIIQNGSFMRISRYYPTIGYQKDDEIQDQHTRNQYQLGKRDALKRPEAPEVLKKDFINLDMIISTQQNQTAIGTGDLVKKWKSSGRNYFQYKAENIPFRFAVSSAEYEVKSIRYKGINVNVFYHKSHFENVDHLLKNAQLTLDYCQRNYGRYPFKSINFTEISSFTKGFAATAYPSAIFMPEDMVFHANIHADQKQDVINELAGHELSHLWWGNSQIDPDYREGSVMLTETLAMYTEMMLYKQMHGNVKMKERLQVHQQIYDNEKGLSEDLPIYRATGDVPHISYSKGAVAMVQLSEILGEDKVNTALKNFLYHNPYPKKPTSMDLLNEFYKVTPSDKKLQIDQLFKNK